MSEQEIPQVVVQGLSALNRMEKICKRHLNFSFEDVDDAGELNQSIQVIRQDLFNYNQAVRQSQIQKQQQEQRPEAEEKPAPQTEDKPTVEELMDEEPNMKSVTRPENPKDSA